MRVFVSFLISLFLYENSLAFSVGYVRKQCKYLDMLDEGKEVSQVEKGFAAFCMGYLAGIADDRALNCVVFNSPKANFFVNDEAQKAFLDRYASSSNGLSLEQLNRMFLNWADGNPGKWSEGLVINAKFFLPACR